MWGWPFEVWIIVASIVVPLVGLGIVWLCIPGPGKSALGTEEQGDGSGRHRRRRR
ncbi:hypothetical protein [Streptomyces sp. NPDC057002]|uniref:hypothetical protein n=1 Tax=Streptomyces sp. NPDC057002 TaxID=3345992 RepID=UPI003633133F